MLSQSVPAAATEKGTPPCAAADSHAEQRRCLASLFKKTDTTLARVEKESLAKVAMRDEDPPYKLASKKALEKSISAFRSYRARQCDVFWSLAAGGNGATDMRLQCAIELTEHRIEQLQKYFADTESR